MMHGGISRAPVTAALIGVNLAVFVAMLANGAGFWHSTNTIQLAWGANFGPATKDGEWWRLATAMFLHFGILHLALNMWALWDGGRLVERLYGMRRFVAIYLISGVVGNLLSLIVRGDYAVSGGASGAIFGVYGALLVSLWRERQQIEPYEFRWMFGAAAIFSIATVCLGFMITGIDNAAHIGGLIAGLALGALIARMAPERKAWAARIALLSIVALAVAGAGFWLEHTRGAQARMSRAYQLLGQRQGPEEIAELKKLVGKEPEFITGHFALASAYQRAGQYREAERELQGILQIEPDNRWANYELGITYLSESKIDQAKKLFAGRIEKNAKDADSHYGLGLVLAAELNYQAAIDEFKTVTELGAGSSGAFYEMGNSYLKLKKYDQAMAAFLAGQKQAGDDSYLESGLAEVYQAKGMKSEAAEAERKAARLKARESHD